MARYKPIKVKLISRESAREWTKEFLTFEKWQEKREDIKKYLKKGTIGRIRGLKIIYGCNIKISCHIYDKRSGKFCYEYILDELQKEL